MKNLIERLKSINSKDLVLPVAGLANAAILTYIGAHASDILSEHFQSNFSVSLLVQGIEIGAGAAILKYPTDYTLREVYGVNEKTSFVNPFKSIEIVKSNKNIRKDLFAFGLSVGLLSGGLFALRPALYDHMVDKGHDKKYASASVDIPLNFGKCFAYNALGIYLLNKSRRSLKNNTNQ